MKANPRRNSNAGYGFTLLEVLVVLAILGLVVGVVALRLKQPLRVARTGDSIGRIAFVDRQARSYAKRFARPIRLVYDMDKSCLYAESTDHKELFRVCLPNGIRISNTCTADGSVDHGRSAIDVSSTGQTDSYAVRLGVGEESGHWVFFAGVTGQSSQFEVEDDVKNVFETLRRARVNAN